MESLFTKIQRLFQSFQFINSLDSIWVHLTLYDCMLLKDNVFYSPLNGISYKVSLIILGTSIKRSEWHLPRLKRKKNQENYSKRKEKDLENSRKENREKYFKTWRYFSLKNIQIKYIGKLQTWWQKLLYYLDSIRGKKIKRGLSKKLTHRISELEHYQVGFADFKYIQNFFLSKWITSLKP